MNLDLVGCTMTQLPFVDIIKESCPWQPNFGNLAVDTNGWITSLLPGQTADVYMLNNGGRFPEGRYVLLFDGNGTIELNNVGNLTIISQAPGRWVIDLVHGGCIIMRESATDPSNPIRNIRFLMPGSEATYATQPFNPVFLDRLRPFNLLRVGGWFSTDDMSMGPRSLVDWSTRPSPAYAFQGAHGVAFEYVIALANTLHTDLWLNVAHDSTDDTIAQYARLFRDSMDPSHRVWVEYSNETWNTVFSAQNLWVRNHGAAMGLSPDSYIAGRLYTGLRSSQIFQIWEREFGGHSRFVRVVAGHGEVLESATSVVAGAIPGTVDALATGPYFDCVDQDPHMLDTAAGAQRALALTDDQLLDRCEYDIDHSIRDNINLYLQTAQQSGLRLVAYEAGQGLVGFEDQVNNMPLAEKFNRVNRLPRMGALYTKFLNQWQSLINDQINMCCDVSRFDNYGSWGALEYQDQDPASAPKYQALVAAIQASSGSSLLSNYSWDPGLSVQTSSGSSSVHTWGRRANVGAWGTGPVNYQAGATRNQRQGGSGSVSFTMSGSYCPGGLCSYGSGSGYKGLVQLWNDANNYIAFGLIHDPGVSPTGTTIMVEGSGSLGRSLAIPVGGYWSNNAIAGAQHTITATWNQSGISFMLDNAITLGAYPVVMDHPSISFLAAARDRGDICDTTFTNIAIA
jgi:hypothetical protein